MIVIKHLGDITKISGYTAPIVDVVVGGSPCQDLSVAGKRAGLDGERSGLFMEQLRIIKEMRESDRRNGRTDESIRPRYMVWENVPGAFSSNKSEDFRIVLEETAKVKDPQCSIPMPDKGKWTTAGCILGDGYSICWRVLDAQWWGVPQRRRRIALVADFNGYTAQQILFNAVEHNGSTEPSGVISSVGNLGTDTRSQVQPLSKSVSRDTEPSQPKGKETPTDASRGIGADDIFCIDGDKLNKKERKGGSGIGYRDGDKQYTLTAKDVHGVAYVIDQGGGKFACNVQEGQAPTLTCTHGGEPAVCYKEPLAIATQQDREGKAGGGKGALIAEELSATLRAGFAQTLFQPVYSVENHPADSRVDIDESGKVQTLTSRMGTGGGNVPMVMECYSKSKRAQSDTDYETWKESDVANTLNAFDVGDKRTTECVVALDRASFNQGINAQYDIGVDENGIAQTVVAKGPGAVAYVDTSHADDVVRMDDVVAPLQARDYKGGKLITTRYIVRRLTPLECERLQGYPDGWTDIGEWTDSKGKVHKTSDAARYKALGNSIALPPWKWVMKRLSACYERDATLASLFDGIGGFPKIWEDINGKGSCLWASEIEEFPIAVTKKRIGE